MKVKLGTIINAITIQNQLLVLNNSFLEEFYSTEDEERIIMFIEGCNYLLKYDRAFFLLDDDVINKVLNIISIIRFEYKEFNKDLNQIIVEMNKLNNLKLSDKEKLINDYIEFQEENRNSGLSIEATLCCISYDAILFSILEGGSIDNIDNKTMLVSSINYFLNIYPDIFKNTTRKNNFEKLIHFLKECYAQNNDIDLKEYMDVTYQEISRVLK
ncbi:MAG: hypothetical protein E7158_01805 [Firmicutes bacterium]|nr:hypothetical protein [Bacillota bacterium]